MPSLRLTHIGGPTVLIEVAGWRILTDPTFDSPGDRYAFGWGTSSRKLTGPAVSANDLGPIDAVLLTHDHHADNLDVAGRAILADASAIVTTASGARRLGGNARGLAAWQVTKLELPGRPTVEIVATPCRHGPPLSRPITGQVIGFALRWEGQAHGALWISGDTVLYDGVRQVAARLDVDVAIVHVGGVRFPISGPIRYTMTIADAIALCDRINPRIAIPVHYEGWSHFPEGRDAIESALAHLPHQRGRRFRVLPPGIGVGLDSWHCQPTPHTDPA